MATTAADRPKTSRSRAASTRAGNDKPNEAKGSNSNAKSGSSRGGLGQPGLAVGAAAAGLVAGLAANFVRKAIVQAPSALAGQWDEALKAEHQAVRLIFDKIEKTDEHNTTKRATLLMQLKHALAKHAVEEENAVYACLRDHAQKTEADKLNHEHGYVKQYLYDLSMMDRRSPKWIAKLREFRSMVEDHMREEEESVFPQLRASLTEEENKQLTMAMNKEGLKVA
ncbi:hemerythrin domain-containing protein [Sphingomonas quercus]|uniref:Hemerythrin domain-containing protein n=1 Tax=Sphingomonas quercus TaxID=2842451 RepID=A0ABS6BL37_9SPHN|nr:hemerythrin domain-containing protein [Sphingomonas quercus]MBU3078337.1 hemerythrin domain-containing protein [Sphingomonas quercus]